MPSTTRPSISHGFFGFGSGAPEDDSPCPVVEFTLQLPHPFFRSFHQHPLAKRVLLLAPSRPDNPKCFHQFPTHAQIQWLAYPFVIFSTSALTSLVCVFSKPLFQLLQLVDHMLPILPPADPLSAHLYKCPFVQFSSCTLFLVHRRAPCKVPTCTLLHQCNCTCFHSLTCTFVHFATCPYSTWGIQGPDIASSLLPTHMHTCTPAYLSVCSFLQFCICAVSHLYICALVLLHTFATPPSILCLSFNTLRWTRFRVTRTIRS